MSQEQDPQYLLSKEDQDYVEQVNLGLRNRRVVAVVGVDEPEPQSGTSPEVLKHLLEITNEEVRDIFSRSDGYVSTLYKGLK